ncbi:hypothetical protein Tco_0947738, partial [Tanacetum coccineum]
MSQDVLITGMNYMSLNNDSVNVNMQKCELCEKCMNLDAELSKSKQAYNDLLKNHSQLKKHCISLEVSIQLKQEVFLNDESCINQNAVEIQEYFEINDLKARLQDKGGDPTISKFEGIPSIFEKNTTENNVFKDQFDLIKQTRVRHKEQCDSLINKLNLKSVENEDLKAKIQDKVCVITSLKNDLRKSKGKEIVKICTIYLFHHYCSRYVQADLERFFPPLAPRLLQNREAHIDYLKYTQEQADILQGIIEQDKAKQPLDNALDFACKHAQRIQELLVYVRDTCPNAIKLSAKKFAVTPKNNVKKVRFVEPLTSSSNIKQVESTTTSDSNTPVLSPTGLKCSTSNCRSKSTGNKKNDWISRTPSRNMKNQVEAQPRKVNKKNCVVEPICDVDVKHLLLKVNSELICTNCKKSMFDGVHDMCHVFTEVGLKWKPTGRTFTIVGNSCPLTRITLANVVPPKKTSSHSVETQKPELKVYTRKPKNIKNVDIPSSSSLVMTSCPDCSL